MGGVERIGLAFTEQIAGEGFCPQRYEGIRNLFEQDLQNCQDLGSYRVRGAIECWIILTQQGCRNIVFMQG